ncbi:ABC transporter substrate-binding protein [Spiractinospora alimapuensis]|uniref:ABC transporter substrate-binding protein n=1 Tax=Spiractinospora alimapuensis TaxID=2820884 RepID=UPI001F405D05|nr:ABC transporter substrate-binding protein [Spiractinospora alimapuensis]QVQ54466.1 ABC transporter substrate-binding protein [Spiractinospora alimapuensis]
MPEPRRRRGRAVRAAVAAGGAAVLASACGGDGDVAAGEDGLEQVTVGLIPIVDVAPVYLGIEQGFFEARGIDLHTELAQGGAAIVPAVVSGQYEFGFSNTTSLLVANAEGIPLHMVSAGSATTGDVEEDYSVVVVAADSPITDAGGLAGRTVAVNTLNNIGDTTIRHMVEQAGGDATDVEFVEMPFPDMPAAVDEGRVDAAWMNEPFVTSSLNSGMRVVAANYAGTHEELTAATYFATPDQIESDPDLVERFTEAMNESSAYAQDNPDEARRVLTTYTEIDDAAAQELILPNWPGSINEESVRLLADLAEQDGLIDEPPNLDEIIP